jgi:hypothetical protein
MLCTSPHLLPKHGAYAPSFLGFMDILNILLYKYTKHLYQHDFDLSFTNMHNYVIELI